MIEFISKWLIEYGIDQGMNIYFSIGILIIFIALLSVLAYYITKKVILRILTYFLKKNKFKWDDVLLERQVFHRLSHVVPALIIYFFSNAFSEPASIVIQRLCIAYFILVGILVIDALLNSLDDIYRTFEISKIRPIKLYIQVVKILGYFVAGIVIIAILIGKSPWLLLSSIGALSAVLLLVFKDSLLGLVAGIQLSSNDMVALGDWIEMPKYGANGVVIEITLNTVKVENFDKTITTIPTYILVSDSFKNWRGMLQSGGRRIQRSVFIDTGSIAFCTDEMLEEFERIHCLAGYIKEKKKEIAAYNLDNNIDISHLANGRRLTNIGTLRAYIEFYLKNHSQIRKDMTLMVRQLPPGENGLPLEIYAFTNVTEWAVYERIQSDIFDHILSVIPLFGLRVFQKPAGHDIREALKINSYSQQSSPQDT